MTLTITIPALLLVVACAWAMIHAVLTPKPNRTLCQVTHLLKTVHLSELEELVNPAVDAYFRVAQERRSMPWQERRLAQRNRIILTRDHFRRMASNALLFQEMARSHYETVQYKAADQYTDSDRLICEILQRSTAVRVYLSYATLKLGLCRWAGLYSNFRFIHAKHLVDQYCELTEAVLAFSQVDGEQYHYIHYENLRAAL